MLLADYLSDEALILRLCRSRLKEASRRAEWVSNSNFDSEVAQFLPPRRQWNRFRPQHRAGVDSKKVALRSLLTATLHLRHEPSEWADRLNQLLNGIRQRVFVDAEFAFTAPEVRAVHKKGKEYRPLSRFSLEDKLVDGAVARYLRDKLDPSLDRGAMAFRARPPEGEPTPSTTYALGQLLNRRSATANNSSLFVAECDIMAFFDCVSHEVALRHFQRLVAMPQMLDTGPVEPRAIRIFTAYLACYSFQENVQQRFMPGFLIHHPKAVIKWPKSELCVLHGDLAGKRIGIPQGGALSGLIANVVLDQADRRVRGAIAQLEAPAGEYLRFCDDMILLTASKQSCHDVFNAYLAALEELKLPYHSPKKVRFYDASFWEVKSRLPYSWSGRKWFNCVPWIQFVGYQIRYDGLLRIRKASIEKQASKLVERTGKAINALVPRAELRDRVVAPISPDTRFSYRSELAKLRGSLTAMGVGRRNGQTTPDGPNSMCWANGFRGLHQNPFVAGPLKLLDRIRERQLTRLRRKPIRYGEQSRHGGSGAFHANGRYANSYVGQFQNAGGQELIRHPYQAGRLDQWFLEPLYGSLNWLHGQLKKVEKSVRKHLTDVAEALNLPWTRH